MHPEIRNHYPITVFYDGACAVCTQLVAHYRAKDKNEAIAWIDASPPDFNAAHFGLQNADLKKYIYARDAKGTVVRGVEALVKIWRACGYRALPALFSIPLIKPLAKLGYRLFSRLRYAFGTTPRVCDAHCEGKEI
jgi:predicted DCC family thiol-disulfide oxidoreductase YuxK